MEESINTLQSIFEGLKKIPRQHRGYVFLRLASVAHPLLDLLICDGSVSMRSTFVMSS